MLLDDLVTISSADLELVVRYMCRLLRRLHSAHFKDSESEQWDWGKFCEDIRPEHQLRHIPTLFSYHILHSKEGLSNLEITSVRRTIIECQNIFSSSSSNIPHALVFDRPVLVHTDVHCANILYEPATSTGNARLSALIDYDFCVRGAPIAELPTMLVLIHDPS